MRKGVPVMQFVYHNSQSTKGSSERATPAGKLGKKVGSGISRQHWRVSNTQFHFENSTQSGAFQVQYLIGGCR